MDLKRVQEELKKDILRHQALVDQLNRNPKDQTIPLKLKAVQRHIAELGSKQKRIVGVNASNPISKNQTESHVGAPASQYPPSLSPSNFLTPQYQAKSCGSSAGKVQSVPSVATSTDLNSTYTLITIKSQPQPFSNCSNPSTSVNVPLNLSTQPTSNSSNSFTSPAAVLVVSSPSQISSTKQQLLGSNLTNKSLSIPVSLASLASNGGIVTLAGTWKTASHQSASVANCSDNVGRIIPTKQVQLKVQGVQSPGSKSVILMPQKSHTAHSKSLFRLLPKNSHNLSINSSPNITAGVSAQAVIPSAAITKNSGMSQKQFSTFLVPGGLNRNSSSVQRVMIPTTQCATSATWKDLSSQTPGMHKPSYVPRKSFPNINNGVGSFHKYRILDGKAETLCKTQLTNTVQSVSDIDKPRNAALKAVLTSNSVQPAPGMMTVARLVPIPNNGFYPIKQHDTKSTIRQTIKPVPTMLKASTTSCMTAGTPVSSAAQSTNSLVNVSGRKSETPNVDEMEKEKVDFLRNLELIPKEQADRVRGRRFRKRRVAANPVYSGGVYVTNEIEPKRQCSTYLASASESVTAPDVIVKRPRGRPRGSKNSSSNGLKLQSSKLNRSNSPAISLHGQNVPQIKDILDTVNSASKVARQISPVAKTESIADGVPAASPSKLTASNVSRLNSTSVRMKTGSTSSERSESPGGSDEHEDQCAICGKTGEVLMCDTCSRVYHLSCATPPLTVVPQGMWVCSECKKEFKEGKAKVEWPGVVAAVHAYTEFNESRDSEIEKLKEKLDQAKDVVAGRQAQMKTLTSVVMDKVNGRVNMNKKKQSLLKALSDLYAAARKCKDLSERRAGVTL